MRRRSWRFLAEWLLMALLLPPLLWWLQSAPGLSQADLALYDWAIAHRRPDPSLDVLVVGIDERSLNALGPWPWPRSVHARLLEQLALQAPQAVLLDLFLDSPSQYPDDDQRLARALAQVPVYLPLRYVSPAEAGTGEIPHFEEPLPMFAHNARAVGHALLTTDADGVTRRMNLSEGTPGAMKPYVGWQMANALAGSAAPALAVAAPATPERDGWQAQGSFGIPFAGPAGTWRTVSYASVLRGEVPPELLRGKLVLIGALANARLGDELAVAGAGPVMQFSGIELHANAIEALRHGRTVTFADGAGLLLWTTLPVWLALALFLWAARHAWAFAFGLGAACLVVSLGLLWRQHLWLPPAAPLLGIALVYFLWSWRRLDALLRFFRERVAALNAVPAGAFEPEPRAPAQAWDSVEAQTQALDGAIDRIARMQALLATGLWQMPVAVLVCSDAGTIVQSNAAARSLLLAGLPSGSFADDPLRGSTVRGVLQQATCESPPARLEPNVAEHWSDELYTERTAITGKVFRGRAAPLADAHGRVTAWMVVLRDLTDQRRAEREREQWLSFMSHDMRTPQINILGLLNLHAGGANGMNPGRLTEGVRREAERSLALADGFVDLIQARLHTYRFAEMPAGAVALDAVDQVWAHAMASGVALTTRFEAEDAMLWVDLALLTRAIVNLLRNAIRHSAAGSTIELCITTDTDARPGRVLLAIRDQGEGMTSQQMQSLLQPTEPGSPAVPSAAPVPPGTARSHGIGLAIVRAVVERHGGLLKGSSARGVGTTFVLDLPLHLPAVAAVAAMATMAAKF
ncbi:CHASE2 domain-containing protein [Variovorax sp. J22G21]|uniref:CHASE2 domain-containing protein n=1 Tax=Variovorax fucosicus TaxID=3053517 RepID=UPI002578C974|nr:MULTISPECIES: CHASE2 domain-containing protein [unclassified Variovorax]MDM0039039.1 CHASE2 domain-containing protein [Variovorax sp. J22R193]MDM0063815.1 CHASE2 domain-containing protein [Variovorax sp. J22G21]